MVRVLRLGVAELVHHWIGKCIVRVVAVRVEIARALGGDVAGRWADVAILARYRGVFPLFLCPAWLVDLEGFCQLDGTVVQVSGKIELTSQRISLLPQMSLE